MDSAAATIARAWSSAEPRRPGRSMASASSFATRATTRPLTIRSRTPAPGARKTRALPEPLAVLMAANGSAAPSTNGQALAPRELGCSGSRKLSW